MAEAVRFICNEYGKFIKTCSDSNPYFNDEEEQKKYVYHPGHENLACCVVMNR